jgi:LysW-gamma-L-lysine carboxypeptidase
VDAVAKATPGEGWRLIVIGAVGEERDSDGAHYVANQYQPAYTIIGEPSRWDRVTLGYKGSAWAEVSVRLPLSHSAGQGMSACESVVEVWEEVKGWAETFNAGRSRAFDQVSPSLRGWDSGDDGFEEWAQMQIGVRLPLDLPPEAWYTRLEQLAGQAKIQPRGHPIGAYKGEKNTSLVRAFLAAIREQDGRPNFVLKTGTSDLNIVAPAWGCPAVAYGPGDSSLDHTPDEHISLTEYGQAVGVLQAVLSRMVIKS